MSRPISAYEERVIAMENRSNAKTSQSFFCSFAPPHHAGFMASVGRMKGRDFCTCLSRNSRSKTTPPLISQQRKAPPTHLYSPRRPARCLANTLTQQVSLRLTFVSSLPLPYLFFSPWTWKALLLYRNTSIATLEPLANCNCT